MTANTLREKDHTEGQAAEVVSNICVPFTALHERVNDSFDGRLSRPQTATAMETSVQYGLASGEKPALKMAAPQEPRESAYH